MAHSEVTVLNIVHISLEIANYSDKLAFCIKIFHLSSPVMMIPILSADVLLPIPLDESLKDRLKKK